MSITAPYVFRHIQGALVIFLWTFFSEFFFIVLFLLVALHFSLYAFNICSLQIALAAVVDFYIQVILKKIF